MTTLITGATGFLGSAVARKLLEQGVRLRATVRAGSDRRNLQGLALEMVEADLRDRASLRQAVQGCRTLYHVAADYRLWVPDAQDLERTNIEGTRSLMQEALSAGVERIVYTSSVATLGLHADGRPADEDTPSGIDEMIGPYKRSKYLAEQCVMELVGNAGLPAVIVNPSAPVGPRDIRPTPTGKMILDAAAGRMPAFVDTGLNIVHVDDVAAGHLLACSHGRPGRRYILGGTDMSLAEILATVCKIAGRPPPRIRLPVAALFPVAALAEAWARASGGEPFVTRDGLRLARKHMYFTSARAAAELGYRARPAEEALADAVAWFRSSGALHGSSARHGPA